MSTAQEGHRIYGGLAHWIKGGIFFWLGIFNLGRWSGSFAELGWAWNLRPKQSRPAWRPSAEFVESALIFTYGSTNVFLEHLGSTSNKWRSQDLEHLSITILFIGGGLVSSYPPTPFPLRPEALRRPPPFSTSAYPPACPVRYAH